MRAFYFKNGVCGVKVNRKVVFVLLFFCTDKIGAFKANVFKININQKCSFIWNYALRVSLPDLREGTRVGQNMKRRFISLTLNA